MNLNQIEQTLEENAVNYCKKFGEMWWIIFFHSIHHFHLISNIKLPQNSMRWTFVRKAVNFAVNFCRKCGEMRLNIYFHRIHRNHRISYKNSPHSLHFSQKFTQKSRPGEGNEWFSSNFLNILSSYNIIDSQFRWSKEDSFLFFSSTS